MEKYTIWANISIKSVFILFSAVSIINLLKTRGNEYMIIHIPKNADKNHAGPLNEFITDGNGTKSCVSVKFNGALTIVFNQSYLLSGNLAMNETKNVIRYKNTSYSLFSMILG